MALRAMAGLAWGGRPTAVESCGALLDRLAHNGDVVAALPEGGCLAATLRTKVGTRRLFLHGAAATVTERPRRDEPEDLRTILGVHDREALAGVPLPWPAPRPITRPRIQRLDSLYADSHAPALLVLGAGLGPAGILEGAVRVLARYRPMLMIDFSDVAASLRPAIWEACVLVCNAYGYAWHDGLLMPCATSADRCAAIAAAGHAAGVGLPVEWPELQPLPAGLAELMAPEDVGAARIAWNSGIGLVKHDSAAADGSRVRFDGALPTAGMYKTEQDDNGNCWRWTGPGPHAAFLLPIAGSGPWRLRLDIVNWGIAQPAGALRALVAGEFLATDRRGADFISFAPVAAPPFWSGAALRVDLTTPRPQPASRNDTRRLGISLGAASLSPL